MASESSAESTHRVFRPIDEHPIPFEQDAIDDVWDQVDDPMAGEPPDVIEAHEDYVDTIAKWGDWHVFRPTYPFGHGAVHIWNGAFGTGVVVAGEDWEWHSLVNLFAEVVDEEGDCRDADTTGGITQSGGYKQRCTDCGDWWVIG